MARVQVSTVVRASPGRVWKTIRDIGGHGRWMVDVVAIRFTSSRTEGVGTTYDCVTRLGPVRMTIPMEIVEWQPPRMMATRYDGTLRGGGALVLRRRGWRGTKVSWRARLRLPWWLGGPFGAVAGAQVLRVVWRRNLAELQALVERGGGEVRRRGSTRGRERRPRPARPARR